MKKKGSINQKTPELWNEIISVIKQLEKKKDPATTNRIVEEYMKSKKEDANDFKKRIIYLGRMSYHLRQMKDKRILKSKQVKNAIVYVIKKDKR